MLDGITGIASQAEAEAGTATDKLMTPERTSEAIQALVPGGLGDGQTYQDVTSSRSAGTQYTNSTGKPIFVQIRGSTGGNNLGAIYATVGGVSISIFAADGSAGTYAAVGNFIVPTGATYSVTFSNCSLAQWIELR